MTNNDQKMEIYNQLKTEFLAARNNVGFHLLKLTLVVLEANKKLSNRSWSRWLKDPQINLKHTQAKKLITIAQNCRNNGQLTDLLNKEGVEKTYLICQIKDDAVRNDMAEQIIDVPFTVKQTKEVIKKVEKEKMSFEQAVEAIKNQPTKKPNKTNSKSIAIEVYEKLQSAYNKLLEEKQILEEKLKEYQQNMINNQPTKFEENHDHLQYKLDFLN